jgi:hypothetical protein
MLTESLRDAKLAREASEAIRAAVERGLPENSLKVRALHTSGSVFDSFVKIGTLPKDIYSISDYEHVLVQNFNRATYEYSGSLGHIVSSLWDEIRNATAGEADEVSADADREKSSPARLDAEASKSLHQAALEASELSPTSPAVIREIGERLLDAAKRLPDK